MSDGRHVTSVPGARWDCGQCSLCCRMLALGPVAPERIARLEVLGVERLGGAGWYRRDQHGAWLSQRDGACVFLADSGRCRIHEEHGAEEKPVFCRTFPFHIVRQPGGEAVALRDDCGGLGHGETPVDEQLTHLPADAHRHRFEGPIQVLPGIGVSAEDWLSLEPVLLDTILDRPWPENVVALRDQMYRGLRRSPPDPSPERARAVAGALRDGLRAMLTDRVAGDGWVEAFLCRVTSDLEGASVAPAPAYLAATLRQQLVGKRLTRHGGAPRWLGVYSLVAALSEAAPSETGAAHVRLSRLALHPLFARWERRGAGLLETLFLSLDDSGVAPLLSSSSPG